jgi:phosphatidylserine/phosphatidylglycerophosphate/cardiolipin synthase-like enzyme
LKDYTRQVFFSPDDDTISVFLQFVGRAKKQILIADYSFNLEPLVDLLIEKKQKEGVEVMLVLDRSQSAGKTERPELAKLRAAGVPFVVGTSSEHAIMHDKYCIVDGEWVQYGSWNYTRAAAKESNFFLIEHNHDLAQVFTRNWYELWDWITKNEPQGGEKEH